MAPKPSYDDIVLQEILCDEKYRAIDHEGRVFPPSHHVYVTISGLMKEKEFKITPKHIHTIINNNRRGFKDLILKNFDIRERKLSISHNNSDYSATEHANQSTETESTLTSIKLSLVISQENWKKIEPRVKTYGKRIYWKLQPGWADAVAEALWIQHHLDCVIAFKNNVVCLSAVARFFLTIDGHCSECGATICCTLLKQPRTNVDVIFQCEIENIRAASHSGKKRRQLRGTRRREVADYLIDGRKDAVTWRRQEAGRIKKFGGNDPPILPTNTVVRKAKEQRLLHKYGLEFGNPALNLLKSAEYGKFVGCIKFIGLYKFTCIYWLPEQLQVYNARCQKDPNATLALDASGGIAKRNESQKAHIFLYQCVLVTQEGSVPVFQMVSADQRAVIVAHFLSEILAANARIPPIVVTDFGWSLLIAVSKIFGQCSSLGDYLQMCYDAITKKSELLPSTFMRLDVCHVSAMVTRWPCLKGKDKALVRRFYKRCIGKAFQITDLNELTHFLESVIVVALSKCIGSGLNDKLLPSVHRLRFLNNRIKGVDSEHDDHDDSDIEFDEKGDFESEFDTQRDTVEGEVGNRGWKSWRDALYEAAADIANQSSNGDTINACYNVDFAIKLKRYLLPYVPLWTAIMVPLFRKGSVTATSAAVESEFSDLKRREFRGEIPMRIDRFVMQHLERIDDKIRERCKMSDRLPQNGAITSNVPEKIDLNEWSYSSAGELLNSKEIDDPPGHIIIELDETSSDAVEPNIYSTLQEYTKNDSSPKTSSQFQSSTAVNKNCINVTESPESFSHSVKRSSYEAFQSSRDENIPGDNDWNVQEEWKGLAKNESRKKDDASKTKLAKPSCLDDCPEWDFIKDAKTAQTPILLNGNIAGPVRLSDHYLNITSTCAFDSIFQLILSGLLTNKIYSDHLKSSDCPIVKLAKNVIDKKKITKEHYVKRAEILINIPIFHGTMNTYTRNVKRLSVECNAAHLAQFIFEQIPSYTCYISCSCGYKNKKEYTFLSVQIDLILCHGLHLMQEAINDCTELEKTCFNCKKRIPCLNEYGPHLLIDTSVVSDPGYPIQKNIIAHRLDSLQKIVKVGAKTYIIAGVVDYNAELEHYITYVLIGQYWYKCDGLKKKRETANPRTTISPHLIVYGVCSDQ